MSVAGFQVLFPAGFGHFCVLPAKRYTDDQSAHLKAGNRAWSLGREAHCPMPRLNAHSFGDPAWEVVTRGESERADGKFSDAVASFSAAIGAFNRDSPLAAVVETYICRGVALGQSGDAEAAIEDFSHAIELNPNRALAYYNRGYSHELLGQFCLAVDDYSRAIELHEADAAAYVRRGVCRKRLHELAGARRDFAAVRRLRARNG
jgi:tetratricopeptide (TPR) repeat protein